MTSDSAPTGAPAPSSGPDVSDHALPPIISRDLLFGNPDRTMARISPDGRHVSYLAPLDGVLNVWVAPVDDLGAARSVTADTGRGIRSYTWPYSGRHLLYLQDTGGDENWRIHSVDLDSGDTRDLTPFDGVQAQIEGLSPDRPDEVLIGLNNRNPQLHDLHVVNLATGEMSLVLENEGFMGFVTDRGFAVRYGARMNPDGSMDYLMRVTGSGPGPESDSETGWAPFAHIDGDDTLTTRPLGLNAAGDTLYMIESRGRDTAAFTAVNAADATAGEPGAGTVLADDSRADASAQPHPPAKAGGLYRAPCGGCFPRLRSTLPGRNRERHHGPP